MFKNKNIVAYNPIMNSKHKNPDENVNENSMIIDSASVNADSGKPNSFVKLCTKNTSKQSNENKGLLNFKICKNKKFQI